MYSKEAKIQKNGEKKLWKNTTATKVRLLRDMPDGR
jgi:hypothetical protein